ncbi:SIS domain-containing protein, partial [Ascodesmis nigricans]
MLSFPITPPADSESDDDRDGESVETDSQAHKILETATHVLATEANALLHLSRLYATDALARDGFLRAVEAIAESQEKDGKTIVIGVGKSGKIGDKLVASMNSLGLLTTFLNPTDALHGDLGIIRKNDVLLLITYSGKTPELLQLLPHLPAHLPLIALTAHTSYQTSPLTRGRSSAILLPAPIPESEVASFGVAAPTTSTTVAMAIGDALSLSVAERIHSGECKGPREVFKKNHPGGAIGVA